MSVHRTVLLNETINGLNLKSGSVVLDCTFGGGGHSTEILRRYPDAKIIALDQDQNAWRQNDARISFYNENFSNLEKVIKGKKVDGIIFDLGLSSDQLENSGRGFSFMKNEPLLMTFKEKPTEKDLTAEDIVNDWSEESLAKIIYGYGEEKYAKRIARAITEKRKEKKIETTFDLVKIIEQAVPGVYRRAKIHFATRTFQALRIAVNDELRVLQMGLEKGFEVLKTKGRMAVISFHSLEDRIVKKFYKNKEKEKQAILINKKPIITTKEEIKNNPRSRSAKLRILSRL